MNRTLRTLRSLLLVALVVGTPAAHGEETGPTPAEEKPGADEAWIEGRLLKLSGEPVSRDPRTGARLTVRVRKDATEKGDAAGAEVDDEGRFRLRVESGRPVLRVSSPEIQGRLWRRAEMGKGVEVGRGETAKVTLRVLDKPPSPPRPPRPDNGQVKMAEPVPEERWGTDEIRELGGWWTLDEERHVVDVSMVYDERTGTRYDNKFTDSDEALLAARAFPRLKQLYLHGGQATDEAMAAIEQLSELETFFVWDATKLTDAGVKSLAGLTKLKNVHLSNGKLGDETLKVLGGLPKIRALSLQGNAFTDAGLAHLADCEQLESLWVGLGTNKITDAGLKHLVGVQKLRTVEFQQSQATADGIADLQRALPNVQIIK